MVILILIGAMLLVGVPLYIHYRISGSPSANKPMPRSQSSWHHHHPSGKPKVKTADKVAHKAASQQPAQVNSDGPQSVQNKSMVPQGNTATNSLETRVGLTAQNNQSVTPPQGRQSTQGNENSQAVTGTTTPEGDMQTQPAQEEESEVCCGLHEVCEKLATNPTKVEYFDDEELDAYAGREPHSYNDQEIDQFREVMTTMYPSEVALWRQSLQLRGVALPVELEDEFMLILSEV